MFSHRDDGEARSRKDNNATDELEADSEPAVGTDGREVGTQVGVDTPLVLELKALLLAVGADGRDATERLLEVGVDGAAANAVESLKLARGPEVVSLDPVVGQTQGDDQGDKGRHGDRDDHQNEARSSHVDEKHVERPSQDLIYTVDIAFHVISIGLVLTCLLIDSPRESVQNSACRSSIKEGHGRSEDGIGHSLVKLSRRLLYKSAEVLCE